MNETTSMGERHPVEVGSARPEDAASIANVQAITWLATYPNEAYGITRDDIAAKVAHWQTPESIARLRQNIESPPAGSLRLVARDGDKVIGRCFVVRHADVNKLQVIYVLPEYQGQGVGTRLAQAGIARLGSDKDIALEAVTYNASTIQFYKKLGFEVQGDAHNPVGILPSGATMPEYLMVKKAAPK